MESKGQGKELPFREIKALTPWGRKQQRVRNKIPRSTAGQ